MIPRPHFVVRPNPRLHPRTVSTRQESWLDNTLLPPTNDGIPTPPPPSPPPAPTPPPPSPLPTPPPLPPGGSPVQLVIYGPGAPVILEGTSVTLPDGSIEIQIAISHPPAPGTPIQVIVYNPSGVPTIYEGTTGTVAPDGSFPINL